MSFLSIVYVKKSKINNFYEMKLVFLINNFSIYIKTKLLAINEIVDFIWKILFFVNFDLNVSFLLVRFIYKIWKKKFYKLLKLTSLKWNLKR